MRFAWIVAATFATVSTSHAETTRDRSCIAMGAQAQRVAASVSQPEDCCSGRLRCSQFLSTTRVVHPARDQHA